MNRYFIVSPRIVRLWNRLTKWELTAPLEDIAIGRFLVAIGLILILFSSIFMRNAYIALLSKPTKQFAFRSDPKNLFRGNILDRNQHLLATTVTGYNLTVDPSRVKDKDRLVAEIVKVYPQLDPVAFRQALETRQKYLVVARDISPQQMALVQAKQLAGIRFENMPHRVYPYGNLLSHVVGSMNMDHQPQSGIEYKLNDQLKNLDTINLSIDVRVQQILHDTMQDARIKYQATGAGGIVMDTENGQLLGLVSLPDYDPYRPQLTDPSLINRVTLAAYEMGSTFKIFNTAMALHYNTAQLDSLYQVDQPIRIGPYRINDFEKHQPILSVAEIFTLSSNIGSGQMADQLSSQQQMDFLRSLGILSSPSLEIPEVGRPIYPRSWNRTERITISYGQGIAVSMLQMARATAAMVNGGYLVNPTLLANSDGNGADRTRVISAEISEQIQSLMRLAVERGTGAAANGSGYAIGGKTGTAQRPDEQNQGYSRTSVNASFIGVFPMERPRYLVMILLEDPKGLGAGRTENTAGKIVAPAVRTVVSQIGPILGQVGTVHANSGRIGVNQARGDSSSIVQRAIARNNEP
ncbi:MAG: penicillin-binding protein 2 [Alphaproteobacteria bacterium]|nr:penicillin-binding protein 2 [Alphaproteobacteria bacterium]